MPRMVSSLTTSLHDVVSEPFNPPMLGVEESILLLTIHQVRLLLHAKSLRKWH